MSVRPNRGLLFRIGVGCAIYGFLAWTAAVANAQTPSSSTSGTVPSRPALRDAVPIAGAKVLLVDDDDSDNSSNPASAALSASDSFFRKLLQDRSLAFDTVVVPRYSNGPRLEQLKPYSVVLWYTGACYGGNATTPRSSA
jgi:hypothetical protein